MLGWARVYQSRLGLTKLRFARPEWEGYLPTPTNSTYPLRLVCLWLTLYCKLRNFVPRGSCGVRFDPLGAHFEPFGAKMCAFGALRVPAAPRLLRLRRSSLIFWISGARLKMLDFFSKFQEP